MPDDFSTVLRNLEGLEKWNGRNLLNSSIWRNTNLCTLGRIISCTVHTVGSLTGNQLYGKRHEGPGVETKPAMPSHSKEGQLQLGLYEEECCQQFKRCDPFLLLCPSGTHVECRVHSWGPQYKWDTEIQKQMQWRGTKMIKAWSIWYKIVNNFCTGEAFSTKTFDYCLI